MDLRERCVKIEWQWGPMWWPVSGVIWASSTILRSQIHRCFAYGALSFFFVWQVQLHSGVPVTNTWHMAEAGSIFKGKLAGRTWLENPLEMVHFISVGSSQWNFVGPKFLRNTNSWTQLRRWRMLRWHISLAISRPGIRKLIRTARQTFKLWVLDMMKNSIYVSIANSCKREINYERNSHRSMWVLNAHLHYTNSFKYMGRIPIFGSHEII